MRVIVGAEARREITRSLQRSLSAILPSLGMDARTVLYDRGGSVTTAWTGFEIAREAADDAGARSIGARILKETLAEARRELGDGTARLACILCGTFIEGAKLVAAGIDPGQLAEEMLALQDRLHALLAANLLAAPSLRSLASAAGADEELSAALAEALAHVGPEGIVELKPGFRPRISLRTGEGFIFDVTPVSSWLGPQAEEHVACEEPHILVVNDIVSDLGRMTSLLEQFATRGKTLAIFARGIRGHALEVLIHNRKNSGLHVVALAPAEVAAQAALALEDVAVATGATVIDVALGTSLDGLRPTMLGGAGRVSVTNGRALLADPRGKAEDVAAHRRRLDAERERQRYLALDRERLERRSSRLGGRWAELQIAARTQMETDARLETARAALACAQAGRSGAVAGGGSSLRHVAASLSAEAATLPAGAARAARLCIARGCMVAADGIVGMGAIQDADAPAVVDPISVTSGVLRRAVSAAATMLRIEAIVCD
jgi:chaperonin GroEL